MSICMKLQTRFMSCGMYMACALSVDQYFLLNPANLAC